MGRSLCTVPWQQPAEKKQEEDHFGSESLWIPAGGGGQRREEGEEERGWKDEKRFHGGELDWESSKKGAPSQGQPKWWRAGRGAGPLMKEVKQL